MSQSTGEKSRQSADKRQLILDSAIKVFAEKGYHGTRISDVARDAGIAYGLVYHYFRNKEDILDTIFLERWVGFQDSVDAIAASEKTIEEKLLGVAQLIVSSYGERSEWVKVLVFEIQRTQRMADPDRMKVVAKLFNVIASMLRQAQEQGSLRAEVDPDLACVIFIGGLDIVVTSQVLEFRVGHGEKTMDHKHVARTVVDLFMNGMRAASPG